jgi:hypothetical protein
MQSPAREAGLLQRVKTVLQQPLRSLERAFEKGLRGGKICHSFPSNPAKL